MRKIAFVYQKSNSKKEKTSKQLERHIKGVANHRRIDILLLLSRESKLSLESISATLDCHVATASEHTAKLHRAGLVTKKYLGRNVVHELTPYGATFIDFIREFGQKR